MKSKKKQSRQDKATKEEKSGAYNHAPFVSTNDVITSWFGKQFRYTAMIVNLRDRLKNLHANLAGNYEVAGLYFAYFAFDVGFNSHTL